MFITIGGPALARPCHTRVTADILFTRDGTLNGFGHIYLLLFLKRKGGTAVNAGLPWRWLPWPPSDTPLASPPFSIHRGPRSLHSENYAGPRPGHKNPSDFPLM